MKQNPFLPSFEELAEIIPIFPLSGAVALPGVQLPLNIFEPRYLRMVRHALAAQQIIGLVQPQFTESEHAEETDHPPLQRIGCAGRITSFSETNDGRIVLVLTGFCRFRVLEQLEAQQGFQRARVGWEEFAADYNPQPARLADRELFMGSLRSFCDRRQVKIPWDDIVKMPDEDLINLLCTHLPLDAHDKQALIETVTLQERATLMRGLMDMSALSGGAESMQRH